jgi:hypothetical protein
MNSPAVSAAKGGAVWLGSVRKSTRGIDRCRKCNTQRAVQGVGFQPDASACFLKFVLVMKG